MLCIALVIAVITACAHTPISDPCANGTQVRRSGETVVRQRPDGEKAFLFVQGLIGAHAAATPDFFWPEKVASDALFGARDVHVLALAAQPRSGCTPSLSAVAAITQFLAGRLGYYRNVVVVTHDLRHILTIDAALAALPAEARERVRRTFLFGTPAADDALRALSPDCSPAEESDPRTVCTTFAEDRLRDVRLATATCDSILPTRMSPGMQTAPPCADVLYEIFREGLAGIAYEAEHELPRFGQ